MENDSNVTGKVQNKDKTSEIEMLETLKRSDSSESTIGEAGILDGAPRDRWGSRLEFLLAIVGYTVGISSIWRFPIKCAANGGGAFLIPFFIFTFFVGGPLYYIEVCIGQYSGKAAGVAFEFCPLFKGLGFLMVVISFDALWYYMMVQTWVLYYFVNSFVSPLPWSTCGNWWNTEFCKEDLSNLTSSADVYIANTNNTIVDTVYNSSSKIQSAAMEFWLHKVLRTSDGLETMGEIQWHLVLGTFVGWVLVVASLIKGVKSLGKVVYVTATVPYILLTVLLVRGLTLEGALDGVIWYITPDFDKLKDPQVWIAAAIQVFYSLGPTYGGVITMASHNKFHQKSVVEVTICVVADAFTAFYAGLVVFSILGFMAKENSVSVEDVAKSSGPGLAFVAYPEAINRMPLPNLWAVLFFLTLITVAFDSTFGMYETVIGTIFDIFPRSNKTVKYVVLTLVAMLLFLLELPFTMNGGIYLFQLADSYVTTFAVLFGSALEGIIVCWIYGADRLARDIEMMTGRQSSVMLRFVWCIPMTGSLLVGFVVTIFLYEEPDYGNGYQSYAIGIGLAIAFLPLLPVVLMLVKGIVQINGNLPKRVRHLLEPSPTWQPVDPRAREICRARQYKYEDKFLMQMKKNIFGDKNTPWF